MTNKSILVDKLGICLSLCCGLHCLLTPFLFTFGTLELFNILANEQLELAISSCVLLLGVIALIPSIFIHRNYSVALLFISGFLIIVTSEFITSLWPRISVLVTGVLMVVMAHHFNIKFKIKYAERTK